MLPDAITPERIQAAIDAQQRALSPASNKAFAVTIDRLFAFARTFGLANPDAAAATKFYREAMSDVPIDLLDRAVSSVCRDWKWGNKLPLPADLRNQISAEMTARRVTLARLELAHKRAAARPRPEQIAMRHNVTQLVTGAVKRVPMSGPDDEAEFERARQKMIADMAADPDFAALVGR